MFAHAWRGLRATVAPGSASPYTYVEANPLGIVGIILLVSIVPDVLMRHLIVPARFVWINVFVDVVEIAGTIWVCGMFGTMAARPHEVNGDYARFRLGALASVVVPLADIAAVTALPAEATHRKLRRADRDAAFITAPSTRVVRIDLTRPIVVEKYPFLIKKSSRRLYVATDRPLELCAILERSTG